MSSTSERKIVISFITCRISMLNFGEQLLGQDGNQFQMNNTRVSINPENPILVRSNPIPDWQLNQIRRANFQQFHVPGSGYMNGMHMRGHYARAQHNMSTGLNSRLELLLKNNANPISAANSSFDVRMNRAAGNPLLPIFRTQASSNVRESYAGVQRSNIHSAPGIMYKESNRLLIPNRNSEFNGSNSETLLKSSAQWSVPNQVEGIPHGDSYPKYSLNYMPITEADASVTFNSFQSIPITRDQLKFAGNQFCAIPDYTRAGSTSQDKGKQEELISSTEKVQECYNGLLQQIVDSSSAAISTSCGDQRGSDSNFCGEGSGLGFDLNKTPDQKVATRRRKHRPKVITEGKPKRSSNPATQKKQVKENSPKKRKKVLKTEATPQADVIEETNGLTVPTRKTCRKALNFISDKSRNESQSRIVCHHDEAFRTTSDYRTAEMLSGENVKTNSVFLSNQQNELTVQGRKRIITLPGTTEEKQIPKFLATEKGPAQGNSVLCQERSNGCMQQYIHAKEIGNILFQSETCFENSQNTKELICQNTHQSESNIPSSSIKGKVSKRKRKSIDSQHNSATNPLGTSLCQEILQAGENFEGEALDKGFLETTNKKKTKKRLHGKVNGTSSCQIMSKDESQKVIRKGKKVSQSPPHVKMANCCTESDRFLEQKNRGTSTGELHQIYSTLIDEIICRLNNLNLSESNTSAIEGQSALVPYKGDGTIVPYQEPDIPKKHKPRPKVDLDPETERTWKLLMGKEGSNSLDGTDKEKEKWWEEERNVFRGRADSFIARMHLVLGDRRFSKWKGSVVDSVIGVFLTQNVSDHLSSSAFMSLSARFSLKSEGSRSYIVGTKTWVEEPDDTTMSCGRGTFSELAYHLGFGLPHNTSGVWRDSETSRIQRIPIETNNKSSEEELLSSQDSLESSITQGTRGYGSCSRPSSESGPNRGCEPSKAQFLTSTNSFQVGKTTMFQEFYNSVNGASLCEERTKDGQVQHAENLKQSLGVEGVNNRNFRSAFNYPSNFGYPQEQEPVVPSAYYEFHYPDTQGLETFQMNGNESFWPETVTTHSKFPDNNYEKFGIPEIGDNADEPTEKQYGSGALSSPALPTMNHSGPLSKHLDLLQGTSHILGSENIISAANTQVCSDNSRAESNEQQICSPSPTYKKKKTKVSKAKKVKPETEKKHACDWDILRKKVLANGTKIERGKETMDSLDYEAVRCASVKEISDTIKERGMNNMLADRIKEFLNRLVIDHGSIDLEWLRHVPPDQVKDYLLSIRGLGLKSVECVRLLTLHHLAFPVDTNVGRIVVRLGWVPLQPLPETLQIHLLELYPMLESIQKYLWPRLCKLDQRTLYELHYQMITFGKVFCTKSKPNCNACPMRAECRHFASAFASARLALPGPEEKGIVGMSVPIAADKNPYVNMKPVILPISENNFIGEATHESGNCEPIIEEPTTPEQDSTNALESDIEDFFVEDPDEIPPIEFNISESALNVQSFMQYMEHGDGEMSKALVALTSQSASIPVQKIKTVSRLRTEHRVYELPDSHPLLEKMDKREPDDPSPYLLAIWAPGETANSIEPPERRCGSQDSTDMCNDKTCFSCNSIREANSQTVRGTLLIPCRTATRGSFPLNGTYFQVNELFADHASSVQPIDIPRAWIWNLPRRTVYFGTSVSSIFKGLSTPEIQHCFWRGMQTTLECLFYLNFSIGFLVEKHDSLKSKFTKLKSFTNASNIPIISYTQPCNQDKRERVKRLNLALGLSV
ncbi:PREDICTED: protein ROS1-like isoform X2 [Lupinus angustifolius]|uniref:protein ROS1-like isoform X2 n=1 Tax=Lupinus angustifolius TaxID=3871 RepID=UPI00092E58A4|nr:PREDICTED: protein ROS1-like isoform X2 [Lupinus angustifolius]